MRVTVILLIIFHLRSSIIFAKEELPEDAYLLAPDLMKKYGYDVEQHFAVTRDGYKLKMFRCSHKDRVNKKIPVFLMHGLTTSADDYILQGPGKSLAYTLADEGYDVWLGNARGTKYSQHHLTRPISDSRFWSFSWHEIGAIDIPTMIDDILDITSKRQVIYIGHSQGTTTFYVMLSHKPQYNMKIHLGVSLSPIVFMNNLKNFIVKFMAPLAVFGKVLTDSIGGFQFPKMASIHPDKTGDLSMCLDSAIMMDLCEFFGKKLYGESINRINKSLINVISTHTPAGSSFKQYIHYGQVIHSGEFRRYDYGALNVFTYGWIFPPKYNLKKVTAPVVLMYSAGDYLGTPKDVKYLARTLPNVKEVYELEDKQISHCGFLYDMYADRYVNQKVIEFLKKYP